MRGVWRRHDDPNAPPKNDNDTSHEQYVFNPYNATEMHSPLLHCEKN